MPKTNKGYGVPERTSTAYWDNPYNSATQKAKTLEIMCTWVIKAYENKQEINDEIRQAGGKADDAQINRLKKCDEIIDNNLSGFLRQYDDKRFRKQCDDAVKAIKVAAVKQMFENTINNYMTEEHKRARTNG